MRELLEHEIETVSGASVSGTIAMSLAIGWSSGVASFAVGSMIGGPVGGVVGGLAGFGVGALATIGYSLATEDDS